MVGPTGGAGANAAGERKASEAQASPRAAGPGLGKDSTLGEEAFALHQELRSRYLSRLQAGYVLLVQAQGGSSARGSTAAGAPSSEAPSSEEPKACAEMQEMRSMVLSVVLFLSAARDRVPIKYGVPKLRQLEKEIRQIMRVLREKAEQGVLDAPAAVFEEAAPAEAAGGQGVSDEVFRLHQGMKGELLTRMQAGYVALVGALQRKVGAREALEEKERSELEGLRGMVLSLVLLLSAPRDRIPARFDTPKLQQLHREAQLILGILGARAGVLGVPAAVFLLPAPASSGDASTGPEKEREDRKGGAPGAACAGDHEERGLVQSCQKPPAGAAPVGLGMDSVSALPNAISLVNSIIAECERWRANARPTSDIRETARHIFDLLECEQRRKRLTSANRERAVLQLELQLRKAWDRMPKRREGAWGGLMGVGNAPVDQRKLQEVYHILASGVITFNTMLTQAQDELGPLYEGLKEYTPEELQQALGCHRVLLGEGPSARVWRGHLDGEVHELAVKCARDGGQAGRRAMQAELDLLRPLAHPNIVGLLGFCSGGGPSAPFLLIFEHQNGGSLHQALSAAPGSRAALSLRDRFQVLADVAKALRHMHHVAIPMVLHNAVDPTNVLLHRSQPTHGAAGVVPVKAVLSGFGRATSTYSGQTYTPVWEGDGRNDDVRSFGKLVLEVLTGHRTEDDVVSDAFGIVSGEEERLELSWGLVEGVHVTLVREMANIGLRCYNEDLMTPADDSERAMIGSPPSMDRVASSLDNMVRSLAPPAVAPAVPTNPSPQVDIPSPRPETPSGRANQRWNFRFSPRARIPDHYVPTD